MQIPSKHRVCRDEGTPSAFNKLCAHPVLICWAIGACVMNVLLLTVALDGVGLLSIASDWKGGLSLAGAIVAATGLGFFLGMFTCWPWIRPACSRINGAPLSVGDRVLVLSGRSKGIRASVYEIRTGQGGWDLARLDLGPAQKESFTDIVEDYSVFKIDGAPDVRANGSHE